MEFDHLLHPMGLLKTLQQALGISGIELLTKRVSANPFARYFGPLVGRDPLEDKAGVPMAVGQPDLA
jgi:hypothetical protein